ncbi:hypothetical protein QOT17_000171 [Balamuthia mandrillaris]
MDATRQNQFSGIMENVRAARLQEPTRACMLCEQEIPFRDQVMHSVICGVTYAPNCWPRPCCYMKAMIEKAIEDCNHTSLCVPCARAKKPDGSSVLISIGSIQFTLCKLSHFKDKDHGLKRLEKVLHFAATKEKVTDNASLSSEVECSHELCEKTVGFSLAVKNGTNGAPLFFCTALSDAKRFEREHERNRKKRQARTEMRPISTNFSRYTSNPNRTWERKRKRNTWWR